LGRRSIAREVEGQEDEQWDEAAHATNIRVARTGVLPTILFLGRSTA
jgi:hypothetical protein